MIAIVASAEGCFIQLDGERAVNGGFVVGCSFVRLGSTSRYGPGCNPPCQEAAGAYRGEQGDQREQRVLASGEGPLAATHSTVFCPMRPTGFILQETSLGSERVCSRFPGSSRISGEKGMLAPPRLHPTSTAGPSLPRV